MSPIKRQAYIAIAALLAVLMTAGGIWTAYSFSAKGRQSAAKPPVPPGGFLLTASQADAAGVDPTASFQLASSEPIPLSALQERLKVEPAVALRYEQADQAGKLYTIKPAQALDANRIYTFRLSGGEDAERAHQWSFQTKAEFRILGSLPRHQGTGVPVDTGIELTLSHENYGDIAPFFSISPSVKGRFERHKKTVAFVPAEKLKAGTVYTVTLKPGLKQEGADGALTAEYRFAFETAPAEQQRDQGHLVVPQSVMEFPTGEAPYFQVQYYRRDNQTQIPVSVTVYRYKDAARFIGALKEGDKVPWWADWTASRFREPTNGLDRAARFEASLKQMPGHSMPYLIFPEALAPGYYLAELNVADQVRQVRFQVTDLASYLTVTSTRSLVWVNDVTAKAPVAGAGVTHPDGRAETGAGGLAVFDTPAGFGQVGDSAGLYLQVQTGSKEAVVSIRAGGYVFYPVMSEGRHGGFPTPRPGLTGYWKYLSLDRPLYKPGDRLQVFGVIHPREPGAGPVAKVTAKVLRREYRGFDQEPLPLVKAEVPVAEGSFTGSLTLPHLKPGSYELQISSGEDYVISRWFEVQAYTKPAYQIGVSSDKQAIFLGETATFKVTSSFFEGTPVPGLKLNSAIGWGSDQPSQLTTGVDGTATIPFTPATDPGHNDHGGPSQAWFRVWASLPEAGEINAGTGVQVFTRNVTMAPSVDVTDGVALIKAQVNQISLEQLNAGEGWDYTGAPAAGLRVNGVLIEQNWEREEEGEYYDFVQKRVVKQYRYRHVPVEVGRFSAVTDADGRIAHRVAVHPEKSYEVRLQVPDTNGRTVARSWGFAGRNYQSKGRGGYGAYKSYSLAPTDPKKQSWGIGEAVELHLRENDAPLPDRAGGFLFYQARLGLKKYSVQNAATYRFTFAEPDVPNTTVKGVYFDGRQYREAWEYPVRLDAKQRELKVSVKPDREVYRPGETVGVLVEVTDRDGRPVLAQVNLSLVDEALFALRNQEVQILQNLYGEQIPSGILRSGSTHRGELKEESARAMPASASAGSAASKKLVAMDAAGGPAQVRSDFRDAAFFATVSTDAGGRGSASFRLPDNLTTWRMTYQAFAPGKVGAASGTAPVAVKIPFFVDTVVGDTYLTGDRPTIFVRSFGAQLTDGQDVKYEITVTGPTGSQTFTTDGKAFTPVNVSLDQLAAGSYTVQVLGTAAGGLADALERKFTVVDSYLKHQKVQFQLLSDQTAVQGATGLTTLTFTDHLRGRYFWMLQQMRWHSGNRFEQKLAREVATHLLTQHFGVTKTDAGADWTPGAYQTPKGSIAILPYSDGDLYLSALTADLAADRFDRAALATYFEQVLDDPKAGRERAVIALYGLASLREPVLQQTRALLAQQDLSLTEQLYLTIALAALGDLEGARPLYRQLWANHGEMLGSNARMNAGRDQDEILTATAQMAALAARLAEPEALPLLGYLSENPTKDVLLLLEQLLAAKATLPGTVADPVAFSYVQGGETKRLELKPGETVRWHLTPETLADLRFKEIQGQVGLTVAYEGPLQASDLRQEPGFAVSRRYAAEGTGSGTLKPGDLVKVHLSYQIPATAPGGGYELTDYLPSGLRLMERPWQHGAKLDRYDGPAWPMAVDGQKISFWAWEKGDALYYYARVVSAGDYTAEQPVLQHQKSGKIYAHGERSQVRIER